MTSPYDGDGNVTIAELCAWYACALIVLPIVMVYSSISATLKRMRRIRIK